MTSQQSNTKDEDMDRRQQRTSQWNKEALITLVPWTIGPVGDGTSCLKMKELSGKCYTQACGT
ncbi:hypothetical protein M153_1200001164 [Pseudoloma neurophilia]|uniref:Uncharacterized protein n=1 Tax=Pseudoloma neurophilia TaxID=146866 RepID=A0A0R0M7D9_9MICR|nr:hypothetical protein M153_1200001164 [Pseudoloma neurophilia]